MYVGSGIFTESYRSGHNGTDSKFFGAKSVLSARNLVLMRGFTVRKLNKFVVLSVSSFQKFWERFSDWHMESCPRGRRCDTRNVVYRNVPRVRIPNSPPKSPVTMRVCWTFLFYTSELRERFSGQNRRKSRQNSRFSAWCPHFSGFETAEFSFPVSISLHLLWNPWASGKNIPSTIAFAEDSFDE